MNGTTFIAALSGGMLLMFVVGAEFGEAPNKVGKTSELAPLLSTASIACLSAPTKGFTKPE